MVADSTDVTYYKLWRHMVVGFCVVTQYKNLMPWRLKLKQNLHGSLALLHHK